MDDQRQPRILSCSLLSVITLEQLLDGAGPAATAKFLSELRPRSYSSGSILMEAKMPVTEIFILNKGRVAAELDLQTYPVAAHGGGMFGVLETLSPSPALFGLVASGPAEGASIDSHRFLQMMVECPSICLRLATLLAGLCGAGVSKIRN